MMPPDSLLATPESDTPSAPDTPKRPRGRPRKTVDERDDGNRRHELFCRPHLPVGCRLAWRAGHKRWAC